MGKFRGNLKKMIKNALIYIKHEPLGILKVSLLESTNIKRSGGTNNKNWEYTNRINREIGLLTNTGRCTVTTNNDDNGSNRNDSNNSRTAAGGPP